MRTRAKTLIGLIVLIIFVFSYAVYHDWRHSKVTNEVRERIVDDLEVEGYWLINQFTTVPDEVEGEKYIYKGYSGRNGIVHVDTYSEFKTICKKLNVKKVYYTVPCDLDPDPIWHYKFHVNSKSKTWVYGFDIIDGVWVNQ